MTPNLEIVRLTKDLTKPQRGALLLKGEPILVTLELPWKDNEHLVSCIPEGEYECKKVTNRVTLTGHILSTTFELMDVAHRSGILIHTGNTAKDTEGCILVGLYFCMFKKEPAIASSIDAFHRLTEFVEGEDNFNLKISHA